MRKREFGKENEMLGVIILAILALISWLFTCLFVKLITLCFGLSFNLAMATGIWLIIYFINLTVDVGGGRKK